MNLSSDFVTTFRTNVGNLIRTRETLRALQRVLTSSPELLDDAEAFAGTNKDINKQLILDAASGLDDLDKLIPAEVEKILFLVAGTQGLPKN